jgi:putative thioredoxin
MAMPQSATPADDLIKDGTDKGFMADVIEASKQVPVIVDFWAAWCGPCKQLGPVLEKAVRAAKGKVKLVKIDIDANPAIAGQLGVRSIPAVFAFDKGRPVDGFAGALPESQIKMFIDRLSGAPAADEDIEALLAHAAESLALKDLGGAAQDFATVLQIDPENTKAIAGLARCYLAGGDAERAQETLALAPEAKKNDADIASVRAAIELAAGAAGLGDAAKLKAAAEANPNDHAARYDLAQALVAKGDLAAAADHLLAIIARDRAWNEDAARKLLLKVFEAAGPTSDVAKAGRRKLSALLFS